jgi:hypothetical protein
MSNNYTRDDGFMALLSPWSLVLQVSSFAIRRVRVGEIEKEKLGNMRGYHATLAKGVGGEKDNPTRGG